VLIPTCQRALSAAELLCNACPLTCCWTVRYSGLNCGGWHNHVAQARVLLTPTIAPALSSAELLCSACPQNLLLGLPCMASPQASKTPLHQALQFFW
jgi:hypothetical protein